MRHISLIALLITSVIGSIAWTGWRKNLVEAQGLGGTAKNPLVMYRLPAEPKVIDGCMTAIRDQIAPVVASMKDKSKAFDFTPQLGDPLPYVWIGLKKLREQDFRGNLLEFAEAPSRKNVIPAWDPKERFAYSIEATQKKDGWKITSFGGYRGSKGLFDFRRQQVSSEMHPSGAYFVVGVPGLGMNFLAVSKKDGHEWMIPAEDESELDFKAGTPMEAIHAVRQLKRFAMKQPQSDS